MGNMARKPTTLEMVILALVGKAGLVTIYSLRQEAGLSWGGIRPSLLRLEAWGLLSRAKPGARRRKDLLLTELGDKVLAEGWRDSLDPRADLDTIMRGAWIATQFDPKVAVGFLSVAADERVRMLAGDPDQKEYGAGPLGNYRWMHSFVRERQLRAEADVLHEFAEALAAKNSQGATMPERRSV